MVNYLITSGEFAKLARTTKRTIDWYTKQGLIKPFKIDPWTNYHYYLPSQILDYQVILLLRKLNFSLSEIKGYLKKKGSAKKLLQFKRRALKQEISFLQRTLADTENYYKNLEASGTLIKPQLKKVKSFSIYYLEVDGDYAKIRDYDLKLKSYFAKFPKKATFLTIFSDRTYQPKNDQMLIAVVQTNKMKLKEAAQNIVKTKAIPSYKALIYSHNRSSAFLSMLWGELEKYCSLKSFKYDESLPFAALEFYRPTDQNPEDDVLFEIHLPICEEFVKTRSSLARMIPGG